MSFLPWLAGLLLRVWPRNRCGGTTYCGVPDLYAHSGFAMNKADKIYDLKKFVRDLQNDLAYYQRQISETESILASTYEELETLESEEFKDD